MRASAAGAGGPADGASEHEDTSWVAEYIGIPWTDTGATRQGVNCWGLVALVYRERAGIELPLYEDWRWESDLKPLSPEAQALRRSIGQKIAAEAEAWTAVPINERRTLDVLLIRQMGWPCHVGLFITPNRVLHAEAKLDAACERLDGARFMRLNRIIGCYRHARLC